MKKKIAGWKERRRRGRKDPRSGGSIYGFNHGSGCASDGFTESAAAAADRRGGTYDADDDLADRRVQTILERTDNGATDGDEGAALVNAPDNVAAWERFAVARDAPVYYHGATIVLVGTAQQGKSSLANFLVNGARFSSSPLFGVGRAHRSHTITVQAVRTSWQVRLPRGDGAAAAAGADDEDDNDDTSAYSTASAVVTVMDTPGVGDNDHQEPCHYLNVFENLRVMDEQQRGVSLVALVIRFPNVIDDEYIAHVVAYREMFQRAFDEQLVLVVTHVPARKSMRDEIAETNDCTIEEWCEDARRLLCAELHIDMSRLVAYEIDTVSQRPEDVQNAHCVRDALMSRCVLTRPVVVATGKRRFPKPKVWRDRDAAQFAKLQERLTGFEAGVASPPGCDSNTGTDGAPTGTASLVKLMRELREQATDLLSCKRRLAERREELAEKDTDDLQCVFSRNYVLKPAKRGASNVVSFSVSPAYPFTKFAVVGTFDGVALTNGPIDCAPSASRWCLDPSLPLDELKRNSCMQISGSLQRKRRTRRLAASVLLHTPNKLFYEREVIVLRQDIARLESEVARLGAAIDAADAANNGGASADDQSGGNGNDGTVRAFICLLDEISADCERLHSSTMTFEAFHARVSTGDDGSDPKTSEYWETVQAASQDDACSRVGGVPYHQCTHTPATLHTMRL